MNITGFLKNLLVKVAAGQKLVVSIGDKTKTVTAARDGALAVEVKAGTETQVTVRPVGPETYDF